MNRPRQKTLLFLGVLCCAPTGPVFPQVVRDCLGPSRPWPSDPIVAPTLGKVKSEGGRDSPELFVSTRGHLCETLRPPASLPGHQATEIAFPSPGRAFLYSALVPGGGQYLQGQGRWTAYLAAELWAWIQFIGRRREGRALQDDYRDLAWLVARRVSSGRRIDGNWEYYESMSQFQSSGAYDASPELGGVQPEQDPVTYNGSLWVLAQEIFIPEDPSTPVSSDSEPFLRALAYYTARAYPSHLTWDWGDDALHQLEFQDLIRRSDDNLRRSTTMVGIILANHLLSAVDALISSRLRAQRSPGDHLQLIPHPTSGRDVGWALSLRLPLPRSR